MPVTLSDAISYVKETEGKWGYESVEIVSTGWSDRDQCIEITTNNGNRWGVWYEPDGRIYGEC